ncbi:hypothetical protein OG976_04765 [Mycobacterium sp. NBC_00419]|uniref:hypothetical protein n=1 Tax=Mycobacterium sp. NBC_00419 TaxID=2975989 RepID=UPI002E1E3F55
MFDLSSIADTVTRWTSLGVTLPNDLAKAIDVYEALRYTEVGYQPVFDITAVTPANAEDKIRQLAEELALAQAPAGGLSVLERAKTYAVDTAARSVISLGRQAVADVIDQLTPEFNRHAEAYAEAVAALPEDISSDTLLSAGPEAVGSYQVAQREAQYLNGISVWVAGTGPLSGSSAAERYPAIRILRPQTLLDLIKLEEAQQKPANPTLAAIDPVLFTAARRGIEFGINTLAECAETKARLEVHLARQDTAVFR